MKCSFNRKEGNDVLGYINSIIPQKTSMEILSNIWIKAENNQLIFYGTDLEIGIISKVKADIVQSGTFTLPAQEFYNIVHSVSTEEINLSSETLDEIKINAGKTNYTLKTFPPEEYPEMIDLDLNPFIKINGQDFIKMLDKTAFAISNDETKYILTGIYLSITDKKIELVSTDGKRLIYYSKNIENSTNVSFSQIIPKKTINELQKIISPDVEIEISKFEENKVIFKVGNTTVISKVIEGTFPDYKQVIPKNYEKNISINRKDISQILNEVCIFTGERDQSVYFLLQNNKLLLSSVHEIGESRSEIDIKYEGEDFKTSYNSKYLIEILKKIDAEEFIFKFKEPSSSALITDPEMENGEYLYILMPVRL